MTEGGLVYRTLSQNSANGLLSASILEGGAAKEKAPGKLAKFALTAREKPLLQTWVGEGERGIKWGKGGGKEGGREGRAGKGEGGGGKDEEEGGKRGGGKGKKEESE